MSSSAKIDVIAQMKSLSDRLDDIASSIPDATTQGEVTALEEEAKQIMWALQALSQNVGRDVKEIVDKRRQELRNAN